MQGEEVSVKAERSQAEIVKTELLAMIKMGDNAYDIIARLAKYLAEASGEAGYAAEVVRELRTRYGYVGGDAKLLADELRDVEARLARLQAAYERKGFPEDDLRRVQSAIFMHQERIAQLREQIAESH